MQSYVAPAVGAARGVRKRGLSKGTGACVRGGVKSWVAMARTRRKGCRGGRFWRSFLATFARHWYTGVRFLDVILERFLGTQKHRSRWSLAEFGAPAGARGAIFGPRFGHVLGRGARRTPVSQCQIERRGGLLRRLFCAVEKATLRCCIAKFGAHFWPPLHGIGRPGCGFWTQFSNDF